MGLLVIVVVCATIPPRVVACRSLANNPMILHPPPSSFPLQVWDETFGSADSITTSGYNA